MNLSVIVDNFTLLEKTIAAEERLGWKDTAVFGGFGHFVSQLTARQCALLEGAALSIMENIHQRVSTYKSLSPKGRQEVLEEIKPLLKQSRREVTSDQSQEAKKSSPVPSPEISKKSKIPIQEQSLFQLADTSSGGSTGSISSRTPESLHSLTHESDQENLPPPASSITDPIGKIKGVGPKSELLFQSIGVNTVLDLINHYPYRYEDRRELHQIHSLTDGMSAAIMGKISSCTVSRLRYKPVSIVSATVDDGSGKIFVTFFNQTYIANILKAGTVAVFYGKVTTKSRKKQIISPAFEVIKKDEKQTTIGRIVPFYRTCRGLTHKKLASIILREVEKWAPTLDELLPLDLVSRHNLTTFSRAIIEIHKPETLLEIENARRRLVFEELFILQLVMAIKKRFYTREFKGISIKDSNNTADNLLSILPFTFTKAQSRVLGQIRRDLESKFAMSRLLQGEVGSGKTIVALAALVATAGDGYQGAFMAPTEILAEQHFITVSALCKKLDISCELLTGSMSTKDRKAVLERLSSGETTIVTGTHAIIQKDVIFKNLGLIVIDEQHRFGVNQRSRLRQKGRNPNLLVMTATPIPRTLCMTLYGDLDVSILDEMPPGRQTVETKWLKPSHINKAYKHIQKEIDKGRQCFIVCPRIAQAKTDDDSALELKSDGKIDIKAAQSLYRNLSTGIFANARTALIHGKLKTDEKDRIMNMMNLGEIDVLISTTIIEVGIDISNATIMVIHGAERFGLAQLHQLRGRVGRGSHKSTCYLISKAEKEEQQPRLKALESTSDGFKVAETDLELRGPGNFFGTEQSGIPPLQVADLKRDLPLLEIAREEAFKIIDNDPHLEKPPHKGIAKLVQSRFHHLVYFRS